ncbi:hypothetical protein F5Y06DRAFT_108157 [Hypoxylon sp. FL0890]|nr:hypothetical protein F5Y06DRAFT_108157 [Hypoxylon sp. FL0890]
MDPIAVLGLVHSCVSLVDSAVSLLEHYHHEVTEVRDRIYGLMAITERTRLELNDICFDSKQDNGRSQILSESIGPSKPTLLLLNLMEQATEVSRRLNASGLKSEVVLGRLRSIQVQVNLARVDLQKTPDPFPPWFYKDIARLGVDTKIPFISHMDLGTKTSGMTNVTTYKTPRQVPSIGSRLPRQPYTMCRFARTTSLYAVGGIISTSCSWIIRRYDISIPRGKSTTALDGLSEVTQLMEKVSQGSRMYRSLVLVKPSPGIFIAAVIMYTVTIVMIYCAHKDDKYQKSWLAFGVCVSVLTGFVGGADPQSVLLRLLPGAVAVSLLLSAGVHRLIGHGKEPHDIPRMYGHRYHSEVAALPMYTDEKELV